MDFVQRNLINERNNLQIELAKANILIAELSEEKKIVGKKPQQAPYGEKPIAGQGKNGKYEARRVSPVRPSFPTKKGDTTPKPMSEEAEYISDLENVIIAIAEQLGVHPNDLLNELNIKESNWGSDSQYGEAAQRRRNGNGMTDAEMNAPTEAARKARDLKRGADEVRAQTRQIENDNRRRRDGGYGVPTGLGSNL
jgi:hypothetical protein